MSSDKSSRGNVQADDEAGRSARPPASSSMDVDEIHADSSRSKINRCLIYSIYDGVGVGGLAQLKRTAESQTGGPVWLTVLLGDGPKRYLPGEGSHPKSSGLDTTQALVNGAGGREVHGADFVPTGAHSTRGGGHDAVL